MQLKGISVQKLLLIFAGFLAASLAKVIVYSPQQLKDAVVSKKGDNNGFEVSLANFGVIPYGHSIIGRIYYDPDNANGCNAFDEFDYSKDPDDDKHPTPIILVDRGNCTFVKKIRNIEHAGGKMGIVIDHEVEDITSVIMSDDGAGMGIMIPSLLIGKSDGKILKDFLQAHGGVNYLKKNPKNSTDPLDPAVFDEKDRALVELASLLVTFEMPKPDNRVEYDIWYSSVDDRALDFITDFVSYDEKLDDHVLMTPHFVTWKCPQCEEEFKKKECYGDGEYCAIMHPEAKISGQEIIQEDLRQYCIYKKYYEKNRQAFWDYVTRVHQS